VSSVAGRDIICLSTHYWKERRFRKQEFMARFARANRVLFVEPSFSMARRPEAHHREVATNRPFRPRLEATEQGIHLLKPPRGLPRWTDPRIERLTYAWYGRVIARAARKLGFTDPLLWVYQPSYVHSLGSLPHKHLVFDLVDDLAAYPYGGDRDRRGVVVERQVRTLIERSDLLVVTAKTLAERYGPLARQTIQVSNGYDSRLFSPDATGRAPAPLTELPRPILGFVGTIFTHLDFDLLSEVAKAHRDKSLVFVGPVEATARDAFSELLAHPNVFHVGPQPQASIPAWVAAFDVCLNPFAAGPVADSVNPLKVYEYLALGLPVVSVPMRALQMEDAGRVVAFADGAAEFSEQITKCLSEGVQAQAKARIEVAAPYSWDRLFAKVSAACEAALTA
jgi:glycosyltransferase involved in cell wall biosynthesis